MSRRWLAGIFLLLGFWWALSPASATVIPAYRASRASSVVKPGLIDLFLFRLVPSIVKDKDTARCDSEEDGGPACPTPPPPPPPILPEF